MTLHPLHRPVTDLLHDIHTTTHAVHELIQQYFQKHHQWGQRDRAIIREGIYAYLRWRYTWQHHAQSLFLEDGVTNHDQIAIMMALYHALPIAQRHYWQPIPSWQTAFESADQWVRSQTTPHPPSTPLDFTQAWQHNLPEPWVHSLKATLGDTWPMLARSLLQNAPLDIRINPHLTHRATVLDQLQADGLIATATPYSPWGIRLQDKPNLTQSPLFQKGWIDIQDEGSQLLALLVGAKRYETVVDFCAGAGGKTLALASAMHQTGCVIGMDISATRLAQLTTRAHRSGLTNLRTFTLPTDTKVVSPALQRLQGKADRVLVDAPCSGLGALRRHPEHKWRVQPHHIEVHSQRQAAILQQAAGLVKRGGRLVYATCSSLWEENEAIALAFTKNMPEFKPILPQSCFKGLDSKMVTSAGYMRLWTHWHQTDGFFAAIWQRET